MHVNNKSENLEVRLLRLNGNLILSFDDIRIIAYITREKVRVLTSNCPALLADSEDSAKKITIDITKTMKVDVV